MCVFYVSDVQPIIMDYIIICIVTATSINKRFARSEINKLIVKRNF